MTTLRADHGACLAEEDDLDLHLSPHYQPTSCYDLALYREAGRPASDRRGVLVVTMRIGFEFLEGVQAMARDEHALPWREEDKAPFMTGCRRAIYAIWNDRHRLTTPGPCEVTDIGVQLYVVCRETSVFHDDHWTAQVVNSPREFLQSSTSQEGTVALDDGDVSLSRGMPHEFGHMLGLIDEYPSSPQRTPHWLADRQSVMQSGREVRPRHYAPFADWVSRRLGQPFRVAGEWDLSNAGIHGR